MDANPQAMYMQKILSFICLAVLLAGCQFRNQEYVDFTRIPQEGDLDHVFRVMEMRYTDLDEAFPQDCYLPDGTRMVDYADDEDITKPIDEQASAAPARTTSVPAVGALQALLSWGQQSRVVELSGVYPSYDMDDNLIHLSGKVIMPADGKFRRFILVSHYTIGSNAEAPSRCFSLEGVLAKMGYCLIIPDYIGYGVTADKIHPYLMMDRTARNVADMFLYVRMYLEACGVRPKYNDIYLMGYSQGGATTMAVERLLETEPFIYKNTYIRRVFAGGGPYDVQATYDRFVTTNVAGYPVAVPLVLQGMIHGAKLNISVEQMMAPRLVKNLDEWINSKHYTTSQVNQLIGSTVTSDLLSATSMDRTSPEVAELYKAMKENSIISYNWEPEAPVYMLHSMDDETVPYLNATNAKNKWKNANIEVNFGHYGTHVKTALRFIYTVQTLLKADIEEEENSGVL